MNGGGPHSFTLLHETHYGAGAVNTHSAWMRVDDPSGSAVTFGKEVRQVSTLGEFAEKFLTHSKTCQRNAQLVAAAGFVCLWTLPWG